MLKLSPLTLKSRYRTRRGDPIVGLELTAERGFSDGFRWKGYFFDPVTQKKIYHWYNNFGQWSNYLKPHDLDLVEVVK